VVTSNSSWYTSSVTGTAGDIDWMQTTATTMAGTGYYNRVLSSDEIIQLYERPGPPPQPDPEAVRRRELQKKEDDEASEQAKRLLLEYLDEKNRKNFAEEKPLEVESGIHSGVKYHIPHYGGRIKAWKRDKIVSELCLQVRAPEWIPHEDRLLAKLLYLRSDEATALRTANHFNIKENLLEGLS